MFKVRSLLASAALASSVLGAQTTAAEEIKIAVVDMSKILNETTEAKAKKAEFDKIRAAKKKTLEEKENSLKQMEAKLKEQKVSPQSKEADEFRAKAADFTKLARQSEEELRQKYSESTKSLSTKAQKIISDYASQQKLTMVLDKGVVGRGAVLYNSPTLDITPEIMKRLNS
jgi:outer membrane protein